MPHRVEREVQLSKPLTSLPRELALNIYRTDLHLTEQLEKVLAPAGLRIDEYNVLRIIRGGGAEGHPRSEIEKRMVHGTDRLLASLHKLKTRGLVEGSIRFTVTPAGIDLLAATDGPFEATIEAQVGWISADELRTAIEVLEKIRTGPPPR